MIRELLIRRIKKEIEEINKNRLDMQEPYIDGMIDGLEKTIVFIKKVLK